MEVDRTDIVGKHIGQIGQKTKKVNQETMSAVLFIDEAYYLAPEIKTEMILERKNNGCQIDGQSFKIHRYYKKGHLVEVTREGLSGQYAGQTALKTREAYGGILSIDESYSLYFSSESDFDYEAISTLKKVMEILF